MFHGTYDRGARADRYRAVAAEYNRLFKTTSDPYLALYYLRIAKDYLVRSKDEMRALERENVTILASTADAPGLPAALTLSGRGRPLSPMLPVIAIPTFAAGLRDRRTNARSTIRSSERYQKTHRPHDRPYKCGRR